MSNKEEFLKGEADRFFSRTLAHEHKPLEDKVCRLLAEWLNPFKDSIETNLEVGSSDGRVLNTITTELGSSGYGLEPSHNAIDVSSRDFPNLQFVNGFADQLPYNSEFFDFVHLGFFLYLVDRSDYLRCISEADRVLKPGGFLSILDFDPAYSQKRNYRHNENIKTFKQNNLAMFLSSEMYYLVNKSSMSHTSSQFERDSDFRVSLSLLYKETDPFPLNP
ncbi:MAG: class I SAM-dependent methyltransferase [Rhodospirillales bacterium]